MPRLLKLKVPVLTLGLLALGAVLVTTADAGIHGSAYSLTATSAVGTSTYTIPAPTGDNHYWSWATTATIEMRDGTSGNLVATLNPNHEGCSVNYVEDPVIGFAFAVQAGAAPTNFVFSSGDLVFPVLPAAEARASAAYTVTDFNGDGATLAPLLGAQSYHAVYNLTTPFADLIGAFGAGGFSSNTSSDSNPVGPGFIPLGVGVSSMRVDIDFVLSPFDMASGTSVYVVQQRPVPVEPTTWSHIKAIMTP